MVTMGRYFGAPPPPAKPAAPTGFASIGAAKAAAAAAETARKAAAIPGINDDMSLRRLADERNDPPAPPPTYTYPDLSGKPIKYNVGLPADAYLPTYANAKNNSGFMNLTGMHDNNRPTTISSTNDLWTKAGGHKGLIVVHVESGFSTSFEGAFPGAGPQSPDRYGFQFHYNPTAVNMVWAGIPNTDPNLESTGQETFNLVGANATQSQISFQILLNRKHDFKYYDDKTGMLKAGSPGNLYSPRQPTADEQKEIYKKGTMYDVEFLLGALLGFKMSSQLRGTTADIGYLAARRIELHLGKSLRYMGYMTGFTVDHAFFDHRMVPIWSTLNVQFSRIPDYIVS